MKTFEIKRKRSSLYKRFVSLIIIWIFLLVFTDRSAALLIPSLVGSLLVAYYFISTWISSMSFSEYEIRLKKPFKTIIVKTSEVTKIDLLSDRYRLESLQRDRIDLPITKIADEELRKLAKYFKH